ncbi:hypothetical protein LCGC14_1477510 [marine sediment metagenome]|uniref:Uncharacterized protein n=1 Tax=marine sediment metagenome TaxID=412755 RepID=A0A0F9MCA3_9ZZZZ
MPSIVVDMTAAAMPLVTEKRNAKVKPSLLVVDNVTALADSELELMDIFTTDASIVAATGAAIVGAAQAVNRLRINVSLLACVSMQDELKDVKFLGGARVDRTVLGVATLDAGCHVTLGYDLE